MTHLAELKHVIVGLLSVSLLGKLLQVATGILMARLLMPEAFGTYALSIALGYVLVRFSGLGSSLSTGCCLIFREIRA